MKYLISLFWLVSTLGFAQGEKIFNSQCSGCHGFSGISSNEYIPNLACQKIGYLKKQIYNFRSWRREHKVMNQIASKLEQAEVKAVAEYLSNLPCEGIQFDLKAACKGKLPEDKQLCIACCLNLESLELINACTKSCDVLLEWPSQRQ